MNPWLRLILISVTVGGGFTGVSVTSQQLLGSQGQSLIYYVLMLPFLALFAFVMVSGLILAHDSTRTHWVMAALAIQIPWISSPLLTYRFAAGLELIAAILDGRLTGGFLIGSAFRIDLLRPLPWGIGINIVPLALLLILVRNGKQQKSSQSYFNPSASQLG